MLTCGHCFLRFAAAAAIGAPLTDAILKEALAASLGEWAAAGVSSRRLDALDGVDFGLAALSGSTLGLASSSTNKVWLDIDGAGLGWSIGAGTGGYDLLSAVTHEIGHKLGYDHDVLGESLEPGERLLASDMLDDGDVTKHSAHSPHNGPASFVPPEHVRDGHHALDAARTDQARLALHNKSVRHAEPSDNPRSSAFDRLVGAYLPQTSAADTARLQTRRAAALDALFAAYDDEWHVVGTQGRRPQPVHRDR